MKFKVGDKVRVKKGLIDGKCYDGVYYTHGMTEFCGKTFIVEQVDIGGHYFLNDGFGYCWTESTLEFALSEKLVIYHDNNKTIAKYYKGDKIVTAEAKCASEDEFDFEYGAKLVMDRAIEKMKEEEIGYSWVKCVGYRQKYEFGFTVDKAYKIYNNGKITNDNGYIYSGSKTKKEALDYLSNWYIFEEVS